MGGGSAGGGGVVATGGGTSAGGGESSGGGMAMGGGSAGGGVAFAPLAPLCTAAGWCFENTLPFATNLNGVWALSDNEAWVVGDRGLTLHIADGGITVVTAGMPLGLNGVSGSGPNDIWAAGDQYSLFHYDGQKWTDAGLPPVVFQNFPALLSVWAGAPDDVWAVGGVILHFDGGTWAMNQPSTLERFTTVWGTGPDDVWMSMMGGQFWRFDGQALNQVNGPRGPQYLNCGGGVWASSRESVWGSSIMGGVERLDGGSFGFEESTYRFHTLWGSSDDDIWGIGFAQGAPGLTYESLGHDLFHRQQGQWTTQPAPIAHPLSAIHGSSPSNVWATGQGGTLLHFDGQAWQRVLPQSFTAASPLYGVWGSSANDVWAVGPDAGVMHSDGTGWTTSTAASGPMTAVSGTGPQDVWAVGPNDVLHFDGQAWSDRHSSGVDGGFMFVFAAAPEVAFGYHLSGWVYRWGSDAGWTQDRFVSKNIGVPSVGSFLTGSGPNDVYANALTYLAHFDGGTWGALQTQTSLSPTFDLRTVGHLWSDGSGTLYADDTFRHVYRGDGVAIWQDIPELHGVQPMGIDGTGPNDVWVVDRIDATAHHFDGVKWTTTQLPTSNIYALKAVDAHNVFAVGDNGQILHLKH